MMAGGWEEDALNRKKVRMRGGAWDEVPDAMCMPH